MRTYAFAALILASSPSFSSTPRSISEIHKFQASAICPSSGRVGVQSCARYKIDHAIPICAGGKDLSFNMHYQATATAALKDAEELKLCSRLRACALLTPAVAPK